jgi:BMFP domain-containing protein YqiC
VVAPLFAKDHNANLLLTGAHEMQSSNRILDDLAKVANGAASTLTGIKSEVEGLVRQQLQRLLNDADLVSREEFDAMKAVAIKAREEQEKLEVRVKKLEAMLTAKKTAFRPKAAPRSANTKKKS